MIKGGFGEQEDGITGKRNQTAKQEEFGSVRPPSAASTSSCPKCQDILNPKTGDWNKEVKHIRELHAEIESYKRLEKIMEAFKTTGDSISMEEWKIKFPFFYTWLVDSGFSYDENKDCGMLRAELVRLRAELDEVTSIAIEATSDWDDKDELKINLMKVVGRKT